MLSASTFTFIISAPVQRAEKEKKRGKGKQGRLGIFSHFEDKLVFLLSVNRAVKKKSVESRRCR